MLRPLSLLALSHREQQHQSLNMKEHLYRYRNIDRLLGKSKELENQQIFFASPSQLNDPMEGFRYIRWDGDQVSWKNLFKHYLSCLQHVFTLLQIGGDKYAIDKTMIPVWDPRYDPTGKYGPVLDHTIRLFFASPCVNKVVDALSNREIAVKTTELIHILEWINGFALQMIQKSFHELNLGPPPSIDMDVEETIRALLDKLAIYNKHGNTQQISEEMTWAMEEAGHNANMQLRLIHQFNEKVNPVGNGVFIAVNFPTLYVEQLEYLVHPAWYAACFMESPKNSAAWGHYAGSHTGVCLKFRVRDNNGTPTLPLISQVGYGGQGAIFGEVKYPFRKVSYDKEHIPIDFFKSIGTLPIPILNRDWHYFEGVASKATKDHVGSSEENRLRYWEDFSTSLCIKTSDWSPEQEHRILIDGAFQDYSSNESRLLKYRFEDLDGIIFGMRTSTSDKLEIMKIVEQKCRMENRKSFNFYQAYHARKTKAIECHELSLLRFQESE